MELLLVVLACFAAAVLAPALHRLLRHRAAFVLAAVPAAIAIWVARRSPMIEAGGVVSWSRPWLPGLDISLGFRMDGLGLLFALLVSGIGVLVSIYAGGYLREKADLGRFLLFLYLFMGSMLGLVLADDLIAMFVFWELTSISSYFLIGYHTEEADSRHRALQALLVTGGGGLALLAGFVLLGIATGSSTLSGVNAAGLSGPLATPALALLLVGAFTKSAQFPFHFWLPGAMVAPSPVSAYLHSATMVKAGVYLLARLHPALSPLPGWVPVVAGFGLVTLAVGTIMALRQTDLKLILAYTTVASLGMMTFLLGLGTPHAVQAALVFLLAHALYKGALFLVAGAVDHGAGTRDVRRLGGLRRPMPWTAGAALVAGLSFMGLPPLFGFVAKEVAFASVLEGPGGLLALLVVAVLFVGSVLAAAVVAIGPFWLDRRNDANTAHAMDRPAHATDAPAHAPDAPPRAEPVAHEVGPALLAGPLVLATTGLLFGLVPRVADEAIISPAASAVLGTPVHAHLALWHGWNLALLASGIVLAAGLVLLPQAAEVRRFLGHLAPFDRFGPERGYGASLRALSGGAARQERLWQHGRLRWYLLTIFIVTTLGAGATLLRGGGVVVDADWSARPYEIILVLAMVAAAFTVTLLQTRLAAVAVLGVVGYSIALLFILFGAPDLAMTQFLFETLSVLIFVLVLWGMPKLVPRSSTATRVRDAIVAASAGLVMTALVLAATGGRLHESISGYYGTMSYAKAHGRNVVNVILVDFRGLDTLGEITVLGVAAIGVAGLLRLRAGGSS